ncbi:MAG TPA: hypothetical protein VFB74_33490, partial [Kribbellaceae bacterium]|nr:hypothetical protein [Kribbellaceae bacterium]
MPTLRTPIRRSPQLAWFVTVPLALAAVPLAIAAQLGQAQIGYKLPPLHWAYGAFYLGLFIVAEVATLRFEFRRHAMAFSLTEVPLLLALFYVAPLPAIVARILASIIVRAHRRMKPVQLWFNAAIAAVGISVAYLVVLPYMPFGNVGPKTWLVLAAAVEANVLVSLLAVVAVINLVQGRPSTHDLVRTAVRGHVVAVTNITLALVALLALQVSPWAVLLLAGLATVFVVAYRSYAQSLNQRYTLSELYELTRSISDTSNDSALADALLRRVRELM